MGATLSYEHWEDSIATQLNEQFHESLDVLKWAYNTYEKATSYMLVVLAQKESY